MEMLQGWRAAALPLAGCCSRFATAGVWGGTAVSQSRCRWYLVAIPGNDQVLASLTWLFVFSGVSKRLVFPWMGRAALSCCQHRLHAHSLAVMEGVRMWGRAGPGSSKPPARGTLPLERGARRASWLLAQRGGLQPKLLEVLAISSLIFLPLAFSAECFTSSLF